MRYEGSVKHRDPWQPGRRGTLCPKGVDQRTAQRLLDDSVPVGDARRYAVHESRAYRAQRQHDSDVWHGYPVGWVEVPPSLRNRWIKEGRLRRSDVRKHWD